MAMKLRGLLQLGVRWAYFATFAALVIYIYHCLFHKFRANLLKSTQAVPTCKRQPLYQIVLWITQLDVAEKHTA